MIDNFVNEVKKHGIKIDEISVQSDEISQYQFFGYRGKTYVIVIGWRTQIAKMTPDQWIQKKKELQAEKVTDRH
jgi:hypothetical protein